MDTILYILTALIIILFSMTLHEAMHGFVGYWLGDDTAKLYGRLTLNPLKHIDPFLTILLPIFLALAGGPIFGGARPVPLNPSRLRYNEWGMALVAVAGPLTNLFLAFVFYAIWEFSGHSIQNPVSVVASLGYMINLGFFVFNIIPIPPLDGSRVLYALAPDFVRRGMNIVERYGLIVVFVIVIFAGTALSVFMTGAINFFLELFKQLFAGL